MYKLLFVEDEVNIRKGILKTLPWNELGFSTVDEAGDGLEAYQLHQDNHYDIIFTDVRMPKLTGLELLSIVRDDHDPTLFIFLSGYDEFEYAQTALRGGAFRYILKSANKDEIIGVLKEAVALLKQTQEKKKTEQDLKRYFHQSIPSLKQQIFSEMLYGIQPIEKIQKKLAYCGLDLSFDHYRLSLTTIDGESVQRLSLNTEDLLLYQFGIGNIIEEIFKEDVLFSTAEGDYVVIHNCEHESREEILTHWQEVKRNSSDLFDMTLSVAVTPEARGYDELRELFVKATRMMEQKLYIGGDNLILAKI